jgi:hypothetical protein
MPCMVADCISEETPLKTRMFFQSIVAYCLMMGVKVISKIRKLPNILLSILIVPDTLTTPT